MAPVRGTTVYSRPRPLTRVVPYGASNSLNTRMANSRYYNGRATLSNSTQAPFPKGQMASISKSQIPAKQFATLSETQVPKGQMASISKSQIPAKQFATLSKTQVPRKQYAAPENLRINTSVPRSAAPPYSQISARPPSASTSGVAQTSNFKQIGGQDMVRATPKIGSGVEPGVKKKWWQHRRSQLASLGTSAAALGLQISDIAKATAATSQTQNQNQAVLTVDDIKKLIKDVVPSNVDNRVVNSVVNNVTNNVDLSKLSPAQLEDLIKKIEDLVKGKSSSANTLFETS